MTDEKDLVERCAKAIQEQFDAAYATIPRLFAEAVLEAADLERLRKNLETSDWLRSELAAQRDRLIETNESLEGRAEKAEKELESQRQHSAALTSKLEGEKRLSQLLRERIEKLERVAERARACLAIPLEPGEDVAAEDRALSAALDALKVSGQPAGTPSTGPGQSLGGQEPAGCSSLPFDTELLARLTRAKSVDIVIRKDGVERRYEADWLKNMARDQTKDSRPVNVAASVQAGPQVIRDIVTVAPDLCAGDRHAERYDESPARLKEKFR